MHDEVACVCFDVACMWRVRSGAVDNGDDLEGRFSQRENRTCSKHLESSDFMKTLSKIFIDVILQVGKGW